MQHALGIVNIKNIGNQEYIPYRNFFIAKTDEDKASMDELVELGYANLHKSSNNNVKEYHLTEDGINKISNILNIKIKIE